VAFVLGAFFTLATLKLNLVPDARGELLKVSFTLSKLAEGEVQVAAESEVTTVHAGVEGSVVSAGNWIKKTSLVTISKEGVTSI